MSTQHCSGKPRACLSWRGVSYVGTVGHFSGGGHGNLMRKYGLASDNIADTLIVDVYGRVLTRETTGEDLFWALRGGGAASFGVVLAWKIRLVQVTPVVTVFRVQRSLEQEASHTVYWWQEVAPNRPKEIFIRMNINKCPPTSCKFPSLGCFWPGGAKKLVNMLAKKLPELKLSKEECAESLG